jgi:hypothetical protein
MLTYAGVPAAVGVELVGCGGECLGGERGLTKQSHAVDRFLMRGDTPPPPPRSAGAEIAGGRGCCVLERGAHLVAV